jgi:predicted small lipoprotein YifL
VKPGAAAAPARAARVLAAGLILVVLAVSGCGQKGPLYLPSQKKSKVPPIEQPSGTPPASQTPAAPS